MKFRKTRVALLPVVVVALGNLALARDASACGGLFCSSANPVNQAAERIVFAKNGDGTVTAAIEILYEGPSASFAWVLPVPPADVTVKVSSKQALDALQQASNPLYTFQTSFAEDCAVPRGAQDDDGVLVSEPAPTPSAAVQVVASGNVGPYDYEQIAVNSDDDDPAQAALDWLGDNGYDVGPLGPDVLRPYLMQDMNLLAFRLSKESDTGSIRPVLLTYPGERPLIPIRPTAVAANEDMGILVWVLGDGRAVPTNYMHLELNEARIDWFNPNPTYNDVVIAAANEAGGNGFVTEQSLPAGGFTETIFPTWKEDQFTQLRTARFDSIEQFLLTAQSVAASHFYSFSNGFGGPLGGSSGGPNQYDGFIELLSDAGVVPLREGATAAQLNACVSCYFETDVAVQNDLYPTTPFDPQTDPLLSMDVGAFLDAMEELVIEPMRGTRAMFEDNAQATRFYTTMSADEMTLDPEFDLNPELEDVSNVHTAEQVFECPATGDDWTITLPQGVTLTGSGTTWPIQADEEEMPYNLRILQLSTRGEGEVLLDNTDLVVSRLVDLGLTELEPGEPTPGDAPSGNEEPNANEPKGSQEPNVDGADAARTSSDGGCAVSAPGTLGGQASWLVLSLGALARFRRRRR